jgi:putative addiction module component (TIGR02574 family)
MRRNRNGPKKLTNGKDEQIWDDGRSGRTMATNFDEVIKDALSLPPGERAMLADHLLESLDREQQEEIDEAWADEAERRMQELRDGKVQTIDGEQVMRELRARRNR